VARPYAMSAEFFPFFIKDGRTLFLLSEKYKLEGDGFFTNLLKTLAGTPGHYLNLSDPADKEYALTKIGKGSPNTSAMIDICVLTGKLDKELWEKHSVLYSQDLVDSLVGLYSKREKRPPTRADILREVSGAETGFSVTETGVSGEETDIPEPANPSDGLPPETDTLARLLVSLHREQWDDKYHPSEKQVQAWRKDIDKIHRIDGRSWEDIERVIRYAKTMPLRNGFTWATNIMSGAKLREKFPKLIVEAGPAKPPAPPPAKKPEPSDREKRESRGCIYKADLVRACEERGIPLEAIVQNEPVYERYLDDPAVFVERVRELSGPEALPEFIAGLTC
jgi:hypothetical protein